MCAGGIEKRGATQLGLLAWLALMPVTEALAGDYNCMAAGEDSRRQAAELMLSQLRGRQQSNPMLYAALEHGGSDNWLRSIRIKQRSISNPGVLYSANARAGWDAGGDSAVDVAALRSLSLMVGQFFLARGEHAPAYAYLRDAAPAEAAELPAQWQQAQPYRLLLQDGKEWRAMDAQP